MRKCCTRFGLMLVLAAWGLDGMGSCAWGQTQTPAATADGQITAKDAEALEELLKTNPDSLAVREQLIKYYFEANLKSRAPEVEEKRDTHVFWLIENHPESEMAGSPEADIIPMGYTGSREAYQRGKQLWLEEVDKHPDNPRILSHAAQFVSLFDKKVGRELMEKALELDPGNLEASSRLAQSYSLERMTVKSPDDKAILARKAFSIREMAVEKADGKDRFYYLGDLATSAFEAGEIEKAQQYASELLQSASESRSDWNYGNALHKGNIVLGRIALKQGDIEGAKEHLLAAGRTPGSPQLDSFGPNMVLAKELLDKNEREAVVTYLESCGKFWEMGGDELKNWIATVKGGGTPNFGANLLY